MAKFSELQGRTIIDVKGLKKGSDEATFYTSDGREYVMFHSQDCCESVSIEDVVGDVTDIINTPILYAREEVNPKEAENLKPEGQEYAAESETWTFYRIGTIKGSMVIRWYGSSNGYYSEGVNFKDATDPNDYGYNWD